MAGSATAALRRHAAGRTFRTAPDLPAAIAALGFVQMDPLRAPARAQDLILGQRVAGYRVGDLDRAYATLGLAEEFVHVHGVVATATRRLLHPRARLRKWHVESEHPTLAREILDHIARVGPAHPRDLHRAFGRRAIVNGWGGQSAASTRMLEVLHYRGLLHVVRRDEGIKVYGLAPPLPARPLGARSRALGVLELLVRLYAPLPVATLRELARMAGDDDTNAETRERIVARFLGSEAIAQADIDGVRYVWPADDPLAPPEADDVVRLLAPFDPFVWDRRRFEHLHGWDYRFEAYTPARKRRYGYYALPLVWRDRAIGWANVTRTKRGLDVKTGFAGAAPRGRLFARAFDAEVARLEDFLRADTVPAAAP